MWRQGGGRITRSLAMAQAMRDGENEHCEHMRIATAAFAYRTNVCVKSSKLNTSDPGLFSLYVNDLSSNISSGIDYFLIFCH